MSLPYPNARRLDLIEDLFGHQVGDRVAVQVLGEVKPAGRGIFRAHDRHLNRSSLPPINRETPDQRVSLTLLAEARGFGHTGIVQ